MLNIFTGPSQNGPKLKINGGKIMKQTSLLLCLLACFATPCLAQADNEKWQRSEWRTTSTGAKVISHKSGQCNVNILRDGIAIFRENTNGVYTTVTIPYGTRGADAQFSNGPSTLEEGARSLSASEEKTDYFENVCIGKLPSLPADVKILFAGRYGFPRKEDIQESGPGRSTAKYTMAQFALYHGPNDPQLMKDFKATVEPGSPAESDSLGWWDQYVKNGDYLLKTSEHTIQFVSIKMVNADTAELDTLEHPKWYSSSGRTYVKPAGVPHKYTAKRTNDGRWLVYKDDFKL